MQTVEELHAEMLEDDQHTKAELLATETGFRELCFAKFDPNANLATPSNAAEVYFVA